MKKMIDYEEVLKALPTVEHNNNHSYLFLLKTIQVSDLQALVHTIDSRKYLSTYSATCPFSRNACAALFTHALPLLFTNEEMFDYFLDIISAKYDNESTWESPNKNHLFKEIVGYDLSRYQQRKFYVAYPYNDAYDQFVEKKLYPQSFVNETLSCITNSTPLVANYDKFKKIYARSKDDSYLVYLDQYIIDICGTDSFLKYLDTLANQFLKSLSIASSTTVSTDRILDYIFGYHWSFSMHMYHYKAKIRPNIPKHIRLHKLVLSVIFPLVIADYNTPQKRKSAYDFLENTDDQIKYYEELANKIDRNMGRHYSLAVPQNNNDVKLPNGTKIESLFKLVDEQMNSYHSKREFPSKNSLRKELLETEYSVDVNRDLRYVLKTPSMVAILWNYMDKKIVELKKEFYQNNDKEMSYSNDIWRVFHPYNSTFRSTTIDFSPLPNPIKKEMKLFTKKYFFEKKSHYGNHAYSYLISDLNFLCKTYGIKAANEMREWHILTLLNHLETEKKYSPLTLRQHINYLRAFFNILSEESCGGKALFNPILNIKLPNVHAHTKKIPIIPDDILIFLDNHINEIRQEDIILMYNLLMETGWRFGDMLALTADCASPDKTNPEIANIWVSSPKTKQSRVKRRLGDVFEDVISIELYHQMQEFIESSRTIRDAYHINTLFFNLTNGVASTYDSSKFNKSINKLCKKHGITSIDERFWQLSTRQTRKTVAVSLISAGASISSVQKKLGHVTHQTTEKIYAEVNQKKIGELNHEFYQNKFSIILDDEKLKLFTEEERKILYIDFCLNRRNVELGICTKHPSEGRCSSLGYTSCASCPKLCTGQDFLSRWEELYADSKSVLDEFVSAYEKAHIPIEEYETYIEYRQEKKLCESYLATINAVNSRKDR